MLPDANVFRILNTNFNVSMHLMVLGASRHGGWDSDTAAEQVSMHLMVLGASRPVAEGVGSSGGMVSMHLMVLGASRPASDCFPL